MGKSTGGAPAPDPQIGQAALMNAKTGEDWLKFARDAYGTQTERQKPIDALANEVTQQQLGISKDQRQLAADAHQRYVEKFQPLQDKFIETAENWDTPEKEAAAAASARADIASNVANVKAQNVRQMTAMGLNPSSGRWAGIDRATDLATAVSSAGAENGARNLVKQQGLALRGQAINLGNGLPVQANAATGLGLNAGTGATNITNAANAQALSAYPIMSQGFQGAMTGYSNQANILQNQYNSQLQAWQAEQSQNNAMMGGIFGGIGKLAGLFMTSSKKAKTGKRPSKGNLKAVKQMPVERWRYKEGVADGGAAEHTGPYAEDFKKATGHGDGATIPVQDMLGVTMGAVKELSGQVDRIEKAVGLGRVSAPRGAANRKPMKKAA